MSTQNEPLNTAPIQQFLSQVKGADASNQREIRMDIQTAKRLAFTIGEVMTRLNGNLEELLIRKSDPDNQIIEVKLDGGSGWK
jgi:hypothetical protein